VFLNLKLQFETSSWKVQMMKIGFFKVPIWNLEESETTL